MTEHVVGIAKDAPEDIIQGLRENFNGECSEVGMYLAMSRVAEMRGETGRLRRELREGFDEAREALREKLEKEW